jgi:hypothetical protein
MIAIYRRSSRLIDDDDDISPRYMTAAYTVDIRIMQPIGGHTILVGPLQFEGPILYVNPDFGSQDLLDGCKS